MYAIPKVHHGTFKPRSVRTSEQTNGLCQSQEGIDKNKCPAAMHAIFRSRQRIANKATITMEKQKRATIAVALSISSY
jgi:hypothetical protein